MVEYWLHRARELDPHTEVFQSLRGGWESRDCNAIEQGAYGI